MNKSIGSNQSDFYIRRYREVDQNEILKIWYNESLRSHSFIPAKFWEGHLEDMKSKYLPQSETFVAEKDGEILGFISLVGNYVGALFVAKEHQRQGVGSSLVDFAHRIKGSLFIDVYKENTQAREFYNKYGFIERREKIQPETGQHIITLLTK